VKEAFHMSAAHLRNALQGPDELALVDVRREGDFAIGHIFSASNIPLARA
jgi:rhodanese-related sulfurtransferase